MFTRRSLLTASVATGVAVMALPAWAMQAGLDLVLVNGRIWTGGAIGAPFTDAIGITGDRIAALGSQAVRAASTPMTRVVDLGGAFVMPAFIDNHTHFFTGSAMLQQVDLLAATDRADFARRLGEAARAAPGRWIKGGSWDEQRLGGQLPSKDWIDAVTPDTPVAVPRTDLHTMLLNSAALRLAGITRDTPDPAGGLILRDAAGEPTGILKDNAIELVNAVIPAETQAEMEEIVRGGIAHGLKHGVSQVHMPELDWRSHDTVRALRARGETDMRFYSFAPIRDWRKMADLVAAEGRGDDWVRWGGVKGLADGSLGSRTAVFHDPYTDMPSETGKRVIPKDELHELVTAADAAGLHVTVHAIGDLANDDVLDIFQQVEQAHGERDRRFRIEHAQHILPSSVSRFAAEKVIASVQPFHAIDDGRWAVERIGPERLHGTYAFHSLMASGAKVTFGSDWPVAPLDPLLGVYAAVTRETIDGANPHGWLPEEKVTVEQALIAYTAANAYAGFQ
ncbi:MAG: amidohydrolase, partial [Brevundimonas sp.]